MATETLFSSIPNEIGSSPDEAFPISTGPGDLYTGGAVAFRPPVNCQVFAISLLLGGYSAGSGLTFKVELYDNQNLGGQDQPSSFRLGAFEVPPGNDGSTAKFRCSCASGIPLISGQTYWILAFGLISAPPVERIFASWLVGDPNPMIVQTARFNTGGFEPSTVIPAVAVERA